MRKQSARLHPDSQIILAFGGPTALAKKLGLVPSGGGVQRVHNWLTRGIPAAVKWSRPDVFKPTAKQGEG
jgi:hypothetical protein